MNKLPFRKFTNPLVALVVGAGLLSVSALAQTAPAAQTEAVQLEKFEVTGSRVKRLDTEGPQPVVTISKVDIDNSGFTTLGDYIQAQSFNTGSQNSVIQTASFLRGAATVNPRGLGSQRFLVLIDGRRAISYALTDSNNQSVFDFNSIPLAAIDSIEYLKDGASAIYGSDAVTGVMNIKMKKNYSGLNVDVLVGNTLGHDTLLKRVGVLAGATSGKTSLTLALNYQSAKESYIRDYDRSASTDYSRFGDANKGANLNSSFNFPSNLTFTLAQAQQVYGSAALAGSYVLTGGVPTANPTTGAFARVASIPNANRYDFAQTYQLSPPYTYVGGFINLSHQINDQLEAFGQVVFARNETPYSFTPGVIQSIANAGTGPTGALNVPPTNPYNPFGIDLTNFSYRTSFGPPRQFDTTSNTGTFLAGLKGKIGSNWTWEAAYSFGSSSVATVSRNAIRATDLQAALNGTTRATALNPFGPSDNPDVVNKLFTVSNSNTSTNAQIFDAGIQGSLFELPGGDAGIAAGVEHRKQTLKHDPDTSAYVGSGGGTPYRGDRKVASAYVELTLPVIKQVEVQLAGRYEDYSDFGTTTKPKIGVAVKPTDWLVLRASFSQSFKAPDLGRLYTAATTAFTSTLRTDPKRPTDPAVQLKLITSGNPNLKPEEADIYYGGFVIDVPAVKGLSFSVDYFNIKIDNVISSPSDTTLLAREDQFPGAVVRGPSSGGVVGPILYLARIPFNVAKQSYEGVDFGVKYKLNDTRFGSFTFATDWTKILSIKSNSGIVNSAGLPPDDFENVGLYNNPKLRGNASATWSFKEFGAVLSADYLGHYFNDGYTAAGWGENQVITVNAQVSYKGWYDTKVTFGVNNVLDKEPPFNGRETTGFDQSTYGYMATGRFVFVRLEKAF